MEHGANMNIIRLAGMALAVAGVTVLALGSYAHYQLGFYFGLILILIGFGIYLVGVYKG